jgi:hypothetical protein
MNPLRPGFRGRSTFPLQAVCDALKVLPGVFVREIHFPGFIQEDLQVSLSCGLLRGGLRLSAGEGGLYGLAGRCFSRVSVWPVGTSRHRRARGLGVFWKFLLTWGIGRWGIRLAFRQLQQTNLGKCQVMLDIQEQGVCDCEPGAGLAEVANGFPEIVFRGQLEKAKPAVVPGFGLASSWSELVIEAQGEATGRLAEVASLKIDAGLSVRQKAGIGVSIFNLAQELFGLIQFPGIQGAICFREHAIHMGQR